MQRLGLCYLLGIVVFTLSGCQSLTSLQESPEYQKTREKALSGMQYVSEKASDFVENNEYAQQMVQGANEAIDEVKSQISGAVQTAKQELNHQYQNLKNDVKSSIKDRVNEKIDTTFDQL